MFLDGCTCFLLSFPEKPTAPSLTPSSETVIEGSTLRLTCLSASTSEPASSRPEVTMQYTWTRDGQPLDPDSRHSFLDEERSVLEITEVTRDDRVEYTCSGQEEGSTLHSDATAHTPSVHCQSKTLPV